MHFASIVGLMLLIVGICFKFWKLWKFRWVPVGTRWALVGICWVPVGMGGYWWVSVGIGGLGWVPVDIGGHQWLLVESKYYIVTNLDCYKLRLLQT